MFGTFAGQTYAYERSEAEQAAANDRLIEVVVSPSNPANLLTPSETPPLLAQKDLQIW